MRRRTVDVRIEAGGTVGSWLGDALTVRGQRSRRALGQQRPLLRWIPGSDPKRLFQGWVAVREQVSEDRYAAHVSMAGVEADTLVDRSGTVLRLDDVEPDRNALRARLCEGRL